MTNITNLWGEEFSINETPLNNKKVIKKASNKKDVNIVSISKAVKSKKLSDDEKIKLIKEDVNRILGSYKNNTLTIDNYLGFVSYIDSCIKNNIMAIDTETNNSLNTFDCLIMGLCLYTPGQKSAYIPVNHIDRITGEKLEWQITEQQIYEQLSRCKDVFKIFHNAAFDIEVIMQTCGIKLYANWDTMVGAQILDENEPKSLKAQYKLHIDSSQDKYDIEHLFKGMKYEIFDPELFALYAATDSYLTYKLYEYQKRLFELPENEEIYNLFKTIEIPIIDVVVDMELTGIEVDLDYASRLSKIYHEKSDKIQREIDIELSKLDPIIKNWRQTPKANEKQIGRTGKEGKSKSEQLADPVELGSPTQMAILLYDILNARVVDKSTPRGTGADILEELKNDIPLCKLLLEKRGIDILINTFIDKMPEIIQKDGRVHARFNSTGTATGRFSSSDPNLQNIPSHSKDIRLIFKAIDGYSIVGADYSGQEPRSLCALSGDTAMKQAYDDDKDLYAVIGSKCYHNSYYQNLEFNPITHEKQPDGKERRSKAKTVLLGVTYGMGSSTLADRMNLSKQEAETIINDFYKGFPGVDKFTKDSQAMLKEFGYVTDAFGRRRHIPDAMLEEFEITTVDGFKFNPLLHSKSSLDATTKKIIDDYKHKLASTKWKKDRDLIIEDAKKQGFNIKNNGGFISRALRQCLNARIQGTAASMTKLAMIMIHNDEVLKNLGFQLLVTVHDEVFGQCPTENSDAVAKRLSDVMINAAKVKCGAVKWSVDPYIVKHWYCDELYAEILKDFNKLNSIDEIKQKYSMIKQEYIEQMCNETFDVNKYDDI